MPTFVICHGAWGSAWSWIKVTRLLAQRGHDVHITTYTGLGERSHLASPQIGLTTHVEDVSQMIRFGDLNSFVLVGHSYGGMVATGVADRFPDRVRKLIYLDAFVPESGQSLNDCRGAPPSTIAPQETADWLIPAMPPPPDATPDDIAWMTPRRRPQPAKTFSEKLYLTNSSLTFPRAYVYCAKKADDDVFRPIAARFKSEPPGWQYVERDWSHSPNFTAPDALVDLLEALAV